MKSEQDIREVMTILQHTFKEKRLPLVSRMKWDHIPKTPFTVLISCLLSLRTRDELTEEVSIRLLKKYHTPKKIMDLSDEQLREIIYPVGFYNTKAKRIKRISQRLIEEFNGEVPDDLDTLLSFKGVGRKTANIVMVYGFDKKDYLPIDTHCHRIPNRLGWIQTKTPMQTEQQLKKVLPKEFWSEFNHLFVIFGQTICTPISPYCSTCPVKNFCSRRKVTTHR